MSIVLQGSTSGSVTLQEPAVAGTTVLDLPSTSGTLDRTNRAGNVLQVVRSDYTTTTSTTNTSSWSNIGSATITPSSSSNKILITVNYHVSGIGAMRLLRNSTALNTPSSNYMTYSKYPNDNQGGWNANSDRQTVTMQIYDSPATTSSTTYNVEMIAYGISGTTGFGVNELHGSTTFSGITLMEIAA